MNHVSGKVRDHTLPSGYGDLLDTQCRHPGYACANVLGSAGQCSLSDHPLGYQPGMLRLKLEAISAVEVEMTPLDGGVGRAVGIFEGHQLIANVSGQFVRISGREREDIAFRSD